MFFYAYIFVKFELLTFRLDWNLIDQFLRKKTNVIN